MEGNSLAQWVGTELTKLLGYDTAGDFTQYLLSMESKADVQEYLQELLDPSNRRHQKFIEDLLKKWRPAGRQVQQAVPEGVMVYKKDSGGEIIADKKTKTSANADGRDKSPAQRSSPKPDRVKVAEVVEKQMPPKVSPAHKTKFVPLFGPEGKDRSVVNIPGRHRCVCQGHKHGLINNCLSCGRVICKQEGSGPCVFCGTLVCTEEEREAIARGSRKGDKLYESLMKGAAVPKFPPATVDDAQAVKAKEHKNRLLHYDKTSTRRTKVIDDESDYYATDSKWLSDKERAKMEKKKSELHAKKHASRRDKTFTFDFAGRRLVDTTFDTAELDECSSADNNRFGEDITNTCMQLSTGISNPSYLSAMQRPQFQSDVCETSKPVSRPSLVSKRNRLRLQDTGLQEAVDNGMCLSMHQPWASLLVAGIKMHEGRTWYSPHRGRLWIAATAKEPLDIEIETLQDEYSQRLGWRLTFPDSYPVSCLLGCVHVKDVLPQDEYRQQFPDGESSSPYVFICENPQELALKFPIKGQHKIYKMDGQIHKTARAGL